MQTTHCLGPLLLEDLARLNSDPRSIASGCWSPHHEVQVCPQPTLPSPLGSCGLVGWHYDADR